MVYAQCPSLCLHYRITTPAKSFCYEPGHTGGKHSPTTHLPSSQSSFPNLINLWLLWIVNPEYQRRAGGHFTTLVFLSGKSHGQRSLAGYSPWGHKDSDTTEWLTSHHIMSEMETHSPIGLVCDQFPSPSLTVFLQLLNLLLLHFTQMDIFRASLIAPGVLD